MISIILKLFEILRFSSISLGVFFALLFSDNPVNQFIILTVLIVFPVAGLTGIESVFFGKYASKLSGYSDAGAYQRQSGFNNCAVAITSLLAFILKWGFYAHLSIMTIFLIFLTLSAGNHAYSAIKEKNRKLKNLLRPILTLALLAVVIPFMIRAVISFGL